MLQRVGASPEPNSEASRDCAHEGGDERGARRRLRIAVVGAGPVGLSLALHAARALHGASITLFDARPLGVDPARDPRTLALSLGSIQLLQRLKAWTPDAAQAITEVHVSQQAPMLAGKRLPEPRVRIKASDEGVAQLGAVMSYGAIVAPLEAVWLAACAREPGRLLTRFGQAVGSLDNLPPGDGLGVALTSGDASEVFDLAVVAEGGVFAEQARKAVQRDYLQTAWVGKVTLESTQRGVAYERFTNSGPAALLPLPEPDGSVSGRAALVWCVPTATDPVRGLDDAQRVARLNDIFHPDTGRVLSISPLKSFALGLNAERTLVQGRIVRIGNAAQTLHPVAGQGLNLGMRDAFELVQRLSKAVDASSSAGRDVATGVATDAALDSALRSVEWSRAPDRWAMIAVTDFLARSFTWNVPGLSTARGVALAGLQIVSPLKSFIAQRMMFGRR